MGSILRISGVFVLAGFVLIVAVLALWKWEVSRQLGEAKRAWIAAGGPASIEQVRPRPVPDDRNAAVLYRKAFAHLDGLTEDGRDALRNPTPRSREIIEAHCEAISLAQQAALLDACLWDESIYGRWDAPPEMPWLAQARLLTSLLIVAARLDAEDGRLEEADASLDAALALSAHLANDPIFLSRSMHMSLDLQILQAIEEIFRERDLPLNATFARRLREREYRKGLREALMADALLSLPLLERAHEFVVPQPHRPLHHRVFRWWYRDAERAAMLENARQVAIAMAVQPHARQLQRATFREHYPSFARGARVLAGATSGIDRVAGQVEIRRDLFLTAVKLREHHTQSGEYPRVLSDLSGESWTAPIDAMARPPLIYRRDTHSDEGGFTLESDWRPGRGEGEPVRWRWK